MGIEFFWVGRNFGSNTRIDVREKVLFGRRRESKWKAELVRMAEILEAIMLVCFGLSWPMNAWKSFKARTAAGTSWQFLGLITLGYFAGIAAKFVSGNLNWVLIVYFLNLAALGANWAIYARNLRIDAAYEKTQI